MQSIISQLRRLNSCCPLQLADNAGPSTVVVKIVKVSPASAPCRNPDSLHTVSIVDSTNEARISFSAVYQPCNLLERPKVQHTNTSITSLNDTDAPALFL